MLENGANSSFVNRMADASVSVSDLVQDPVLRTEEDAQREDSPPGQPHPQIAQPWPGSWSPAASSAANFAALAAAEPRPLIIAHRGASGYLPEHTLAAKALAYGQGADYLEQDVVLSKDGVPVIFHDTHIDTTTDVAKIGRAHV